MNSLSSFYETLKKTLLNKNIGYQGIVYREASENIKKWFCDIYAFQDDVRKPEVMHDYALRSLKGKREDYYISLELAKLITLNSTSLVKAEVAKYFLSLKQREKKEEMLTKDQVLAVLELTKVMGMISCQKSVEKQHQNKYNQSQGKP